MVAHDRRFKAFVTYLPLVFPTNWWDVFRFEVAWRFSKTARCRLMQEVDKGIDAKNVNTGCKKPKPRNAVSVMPTIFELCES